MSQQPFYVGLDVGGTTIRAAVVDVVGQLRHRPVARPTEPARGQALGLQTMAEVVRGAIAAAGLSARDITAIGAAVPGPLDLASGVMLNPPNFKPWRDVPVREFLEEHFDLPVAFQNDANAAALGECWVGAGCHCHSLVMFTLGTGVGGGIVIGGAIVEGEQSHGGELGHVKIERTNGRLCGCGQRGCVEAYASAPAIVARLREAVEAGASSSLAGRADIAAQDVFEAAANGDACAQAIVSETAGALGFAAANMMHIIDPNMIVFAGGVAGAGLEFLEMIRSAARALAFPTPAAKCEFRYSSLGAHTGVIGAAACARSLFRRRQGLAR